MCSGAMPLSISLVMALCASSRRANRATTVRSCDIATDLPRLIAVCEVEDPDEPLPFAELEHDDTDAAHSCGMNLGGVYRRRSLGCRARQSHSGPFGAGPCSC